MAEIIKDGLVLGAAIIVCVAVIVFIIRLLEKSGLFETVGNKLFEKCDSLIKRNDKTKSKPRQEFFPAAVFSMNLFCCLFVLSYCP